MSEEKHESDSEITLAKWTDRFFAWLIDFIIISSISAIIIFLSFTRTSCQPPTSQEMHTQYNIQQDDWPFIYKLISKVARVELFSV